MTTDAAALKQAAIKYRKAVKRAEEIQAQASAELAVTLKAAYADGQGMKKSDILLATDHVWSRTWLDNALKRTDSTTTPAE